VDNFLTGKKENTKKPFLNNQSFEMIGRDIRNFDTCRQVCNDMDYILHQVACGSMLHSIKYLIL
jgi:UDP-N-acetylglucosamine 4-epimerase